MERIREISWKRTVFALLLFGVAFGYLEAAVVSYLRLLHEPARQRFYPGRPPNCSRCLRSANYAPQAPIRCRRSPLKSDVRRLPF